MSNTEQVNTAVASLPKTSDILNKNILSEKVCETNQKQEINGGCVIKICYKATKVDSVAIG